ncbi:MAG: flagellar motor protein MotB [Thermodesulfobacteriota bacterium]|nr:flagellar motor protein MotB [Thermodesulfobacteriota bacterium]
MADDKEEEAPVLASFQDEEEEGSGGGAPKWMATFADLVTLLLCFFVLLFAMSTTQQETFKELVESLRSALGVQSAPETGTREGLTMHAVPSEKPVDNQKIDELGGMIQKEIDDIVSEVRELVMFNKLGGMVSVSETDVGVVITLSDLLLFEPGGTELTPRGMDIMKKVASILSRFAYHVKVKGFTDATPISTPRIPSNWELSSLRACTVVRLIVDRGVNPQLISAEGYAQYHPVATNDTNQGRARNRRVELVYERDSIARAFAGMETGK